MQDAIETKQRADLFPGRPINDKRINRLLPSALPLAVLVLARAGNPALFHLTRYSFNKLNVFTEGIWFSLSAFYGCMQRMCETSIHAPSLHFLEMLQTPHFVTVDRWLRSISY